MADNPQVFAPGCRNELVSRGPTSGAVDPDAQDNQWQASPLAAISTFRVGAASGFPQATDIIEYRICNTNGLCDTGVVTITVTD